MFAVWSEPARQIRVHAHSLAGGTALIRREDVPSLPAAEAWLLSWGFLTSEPWQPVDADLSELRVDLVRRVPVPA